jgi:hypothetical protein
MLKAEKPLAKGMAIDFALDSGKGVSGIVGTALKAPMDVTLGVAQGFGNLPKAYGDETVRKKEKVTGFGSGLKVAGKASYFWGQTERSKGANFVRGSDSGCLMGFRDWLHNRSRVPSRGVLWDS